MNQASFLSLAHKKKLRCEKFLDEMRRVVPWDKLCNVIKPHYKKSPLGRRPKDLEMMVKIHCLQQWYNLSDPGCEEAIYDRNSFQKFLGIDLLSDEVPDETTILNFRHLLEEHKLTKKIFEVINKHLTEQGLLMKEGTIVDATLIASAKSTKNQDGQRDPEMSSTWKGGSWHFGMKANIGVDAKSGLVHSVEPTTAREHDRNSFDHLLHGEERAIFGDKGYVKVDDKKWARSEGIFWGVLDKAQPNHPLSSSQNKRNEKLRSIRAKVEHPFQVIKCQWKYCKTRYRGIEKNACQLYMLFGLHNLFKVRRILLAVA